MKGIHKNLKSIGLAIAVGMGLFTTTASAQYNDYSQQGYDAGYYDDRYDYGDYQQFYDELAPHGTWMQDPNYGYVWSPRGVGRDFRPYYSNGRWAMSNMGNIWMSDYAWGSIPFHYGRWYHSDFYGWLWIPGSQWAPSWVIWREGGGYYGWAPMGPGMNLNMNFGALNISLNLWNFIPSNHIYTGYYNRYRYTGYGNSFYQQTTIINNYYTHGGHRFFAGPKAHDVRRVLGRDVHVYNVNTVNTRGRNRISGNNITVHAPRVNRAQSRNVGAPKQFSRIDNNRAIRTDYGRSAVANNNARSQNGRNSNVNSRSNTPAVNNRATTPAVNNRGNRMGNTNRNDNNNRTINNSNSNNGNTRQSNTNVNRSTMPATQPARTPNTSQQRSNIDRTNNRSNTNRASNTPATRSMNAQPSRSTATVPARVQTPKQQPARATSTPRSNNQPTMRASQPARSSNVSASPARSSNRAATPARSNNDRGGRGR